MGMRATIAVIDGNEAKCTSVQWSSFLDRSITHSLSNSSNYEESVRKLFETITSYSHISAVEVLNADDKVGSNSITLDNGLTISYPEEDTIDFGDTLAMRTFTGEDLDDLYEKIIDFHCEDGLSAVYNLSYPDEITFIYENREDYTNTKNVFESITLDDLAEGKETNYPFRD